MQRNKKFRMIDPDSYPVDIDPYQEIDTMQPPNFLNQLHDWFSNISSKMKQKTVSYKSSVGDYDSDFLKSNIGSTISILGETNFPYNFTKHQLKNMRLRGNILRHTRNAHSASLPIEGTCRNHSPAFVSPKDLGSNFGT